MSTHPAEPCSGTFQFANHENEYFNRLNPFEVTQILVRILELWELVVSQQRIRGIFDGVNRPQAREICQLYKLMVYETSTTWTASFRPVLQHRAFVLSRDVSWKPSLHFFTAFHFA